MSVDPATADQRSDFGGFTYYFCSAGCKETFDKDPDKYIARAQTEPTH
jgi:Cu+-exporting ATPase